MFLFLMQTIIVLIIPAWAASKVFRAHRMFSAAEREFSAMLGQGKHAKEAFNNRTDSLIEVHRRITAGSASMSAPVSSGATVLVQGDPVGLTAQDMLILEAVKDDLQQTRTVRQPVLLNAALLRELAHGSVSGARAILERALLTAKGKDGSIDKPIIVIGGVAALIGVAKTNKPGDLPYKGVHAFWVYLAVKIYKHPNLTYSPKSNPSIKLHGVAALEELVHNF